jgi:hypothetical protein
MITTMWAVLWKFPRSLARAARWRRLVFTDRPVSFDWRVWTNDRFEE